MNKSSSSSFRRTSTFAAIIQKGMLVAIKNVPSGPRAEKGFFPPPFSVSLSVGAFSFTSLRDTFFRVWPGGEHLDEKLLECEREKKP